MSDKYKLVSLSPLLKILDGKVKHLYFVVVIVGIGGNGRLQNVQNYVLMWMHIMKELKHLHCTSRKRGPVKGKFQQATWLVS